MHFIANFFPNPRTFAFLIPTVNNKEFCNTPKKTQAFTRASNCRKELHNSLKIYCNNELILLITLIFLTLTDFD